MTDQPSTQNLPSITLQDHVQGLDNAPVTLIEYGDYQCPYCGRSHPIIQDIVEREGDRVRYIFRHFPIRSLHPQAQLAAEAAEAAAAQGKFWEMHDLLFDHQDALDKASLVRHARTLGLDVERFQHDLAEHTYAGRVRQDFQEGRRSGVAGTPTFFINGVQYTGAWDEEPLLAAIRQPATVRVRLLAEAFAQQAASGGIVLLLCTLLALLWANSPWAAGYFGLWETDLALTLGGWSLAEHLLGWVNDGLMVLFFFVVGLEIKREVTAGELSERKQAVLPIAAALGGMLIPALFYTLFNANGPGSGGWGVPVATDIAFTLGILTLLGRRVPLSLKVFFTALAIADDLGAVLVLALFYTNDISWISLGVAALLFFVLVALNRARVYSTLPYALLGVGMWLAFLTSGIHPTIAGVLAAFTIPTRRPANMQVLLAQCTATLETADDLYDASPNDSRYQAAVQTLEAVAERLQSPAQRLEQQLQPWTTYLVLPLFALANAGVRLQENLAQVLLNPIGLGIVAGLVLGKPLGITLFSWLAVRFNLAELPTGVSWPQLTAASILAGIGFTMSLFIAETAFGDAATLDAAKISILVASVIAAAVGWVALRMVSPRYDERTPLKTPSTPQAEGSLG